MLKIICAITGHWWRNPVLRDVEWSQSCRCCGHTEKPTYAEIEAWVDHGLGCDRVKGFKPS